MANKDQIELDVLLRILGDTGSFTKEVSGSTTQIKNLSRYVVEASKAVSKMTEDFDRLAKHLEGIKLNQAISTLRSGGLKTALTNAQVQGEINKIKASVARESIIGAAAKAGRDRQKALRDESVLNLSQNRVSQLGNSKAELTLQIEATKLREAELVSLARSGKIRTENGKKIQDELGKERNILDQLIARRERLIELEKAQGQLSKLSSKITASGSLFRAAGIGQRSAEAAQDPRLASQFKKDRYRQVIEQATLRLEQERIKALAGQANSVGLYERRLASLQTSLKQYTEQVKQTEAAERRLAQQQAQMAKQQGKAVPLSYEQKLAQQRQHSVDRVTGDGGASIFKIQGQLAANYLVMNSLFNLIGYGSQFVLELDNSFKQLQAITATTDTEMQGLKETIVEASQATRFMATDVANAATILGQAGFTGRQIAEAIKPIAQFATAVGSSLEEAVDVVTSSLSIFNMRAEETGYVANVLTGALNLSKLNMDKLALGLQYAGNIAAQSGVSFEELTAVLAAMSQSGIRSGSTLGTGLREVIVSLQAPTEDLTAELASVGLTLNDVDIKSRGLTTVLKTMKDAGFGSANAFRSMEVRGAAAYSAILNQVDTLEGLQQQFILSNAAVEANNVQMQSLSANVDRLKNAFGTFIADGASPLTSALASIAGGLANVINWFSKAGPITKTVTTAMAALIATFVAVKTTALAAGLVGLTTLSTSLSKLTLSAGLVTTSLRAFGTSLYFALGPVGLVAAGVAAVTTAFLVFNNEASNSARTMDELKAKVDEAKGKYEEWQSRIESVDARMQEISDRYDVLSKDQDALNTEVLKAITSFGQFGLKIDATTATVDNLAGALAQLRGEFVKLGAVEAENVTISLQNQLSGISSQAKDLTRRRLLADTQTQVGAFLGPNQLAAYQTAANNLVVDPTTLKGQARVDQQAIATQSYAVLTDLLGQASKQKNLLEGRQNRGEDLTAKERSQLRGVTSLVENLSNAVNVSSSSLNAIMSLGTAESAKIKGMVESSPAVKKYQEALIEAQNKASFAAAANKLKQTKPGVDLTDPETTRNVVLPYVRNVQSEADKILQARLTEAKTAITQQLKTEGATDSQIKQAVEQLETGYTNWKENFNSRLKSESEGINKFNEKVKERKDRVLQIEEQNLDSAFSAAKTNRDVSKLKAITEKKKALAEQRVKFEIDELNKELADEKIQSQKAVISDEITQKQQSLNFQLQEIDANFTEAVRQAEKTPAGVANMADKMKLINGRIAASNAQLQAVIDNADLLEEANSTPGSAAYNKYSTADLNKAQRDSSAAKRELAARQVAQYAQEFESLQKETGKGRNYFASLGDNNDVDRLAEMSGASKDYVATLKAQQEVYTKLVEAQKKDAILNGTGLPQAMSFHENFKAAIDDLIEANTGLANNYSYISDLVNEAFGKAKESFGSFVKDAVTGTKSVSQAFKDMATNILSAMLDVVSNQLAQQFVGGILGYVGGMFGPSASASAATAAARGAANPNLYGPGFALGGFVRKAGGGGLPARDIIPALLQPGEFVLRKQAVDALGRQNLDSLNALGNRTISSAPMPVFGTDKAEGSGTVNVYVVSPDARPSLTPNDVIVTISEDLARGGKTKQLVKSIVMGK